jgi:hypothetical protein
MNSSAIHFPDRKVVARDLIPVRFTPPLISYRASVRMLHFNRLLSRSFDYTTDGGCGRRWFVC